MLYTVLCCRLFYSADSAAEHIIRVGNSLGMIFPCLAQFDSDNKIPECSSIRSIPG